MKVPEVHILTPSDWRKYKAIRLKSLKESPDAFGSTYKSEAIFTDDIWMKRLAKVEDDAQNYPLIAELNSRPVGLTVGRIDSANNDILHVYQMWVDPDYRGLGIGELLLDQVVKWSGSNNTNLVVLSVTDTNVAAKTLYLSYGFQETGDFEPLREGSDIMVNKLELHVNVKGV
jgi:ribosomal protein S18 acetylase RimI-like enzyme